MQMGDIDALNASSPTDQLPPAWKVSIVDDIGTSKCYSHSFTLLQ